MRGPLHHAAGLSELTPRFGSRRAGPRTLRAPADVTERRKMVSGYYGRLLWQPQVSVRASISHSVGESKGERGNETEGERWAGEKNLQRKKGGEISRGGEVWK